MKLTKKDIGAFIAKPAASYRAVLLFGPDEGQVGIYRKQALAAILGKAADEMATTRLASDKIVSDPSLLFEALSSMSLLGDISVVVVDNATDKLSTIIKDALSQPGSQNFLILCGGELGSSSSLRVLFERDKSLAAFACYRDEGADLGRMLESSFREQGIRADRDAINYLAVQLGNDRGVTQQEIEKICLYLGDEKNLTLGDVRSISGGNDTLSMDELCLALGNGQYAAVFSLTQKLIAEGTSGVALLRMAARHFERLKSAKYLMQQGKNADEAMGKLKPPVFWKSQAAFRKQLQALPLQKITLVLSVLLEGEISIKHGKEQEAACLYALTQTCRLAS